MPDGNLPQHQALWAFGDVCLIPSDIGDNESKTSSARGEIAIALLPRGDITYLNTRTMHKIVRNDFTVIPTPQFIIEYLNRHVGNRYAASRQNPVYRSLRGEIIGDAPREDTLETPQQIAEATEPVVEMNSETPDIANIQQDSPLTDSVQVTEAAEPESAEIATEPEELPQPDAGGDQELPDSESVEAPTLNVEDFQRRYPIWSTRTTWREQSYFVASAGTHTSKVNKALNIEEYTSSNISSL